MVTFEIFRVSVLRTVVLVIVLLELSMDFTRLLLHPAKTRAHPSTSTCARARAHRSTGACMRARGRPMRRTRYFFNALIVSKVFLNSVAVHRPERLPGD